MSLATCLFTKNAVLRNHLAQRCYPTAPGPPAVVPLWWRS